jgi:Meiotically up-regulated gene 113
MVGVAADLRNVILNEIRRIAAENGNTPPGKGKFTKETGISEGAWAGRFWARWGDAVSEAGFVANKLNEATPIEYLFSKLRECCNHYSRFPTQREMKLFRRLDDTMPSIESYQSRFDAGNLRQEFRQWMAKRADLSQFEIELLGSLESSVVVVRGAAGARKSGYVYAMKSGQFYKIGRSDDVERRVKQINVALPEKGDIIHFIETDDPVGIEEYWHKRLAAFRKNGEWFELPDAELAAFKKRKFQ